MSSSGVCLDIAVDHRIERLFIAVQLPVGTALPDSDNDEAFDDIADFTAHHIRALDSNEINVTKRLAGPYGVTGGILVMLQQPAEDHQFQKGTAATVRECMTLKELHNTFHTVSRGTVGIADINVLDITPFVRPSDGKDLNPSVREGLQHHVLKTVKERKPAVVMCASRSYETAGPLKCFAGLGVGKTIFERHNAEGDQPFKVNAFHPSYALNFYPWDPDCRQLLLLEAIHVCRRWSGDWVEEDWMLELRERCRVSSETRYGICYPFRKFYWIRLTLLQLRMHTRGVPLKVI